MVFSSSAFAGEMYPGKFFGKGEVLLCALRDGARSVAKIKFSNPTLKQENVDRLSVVAATATAAGSFIGVTGKSTKNKALVAAALKNGIENTDVPVIVFDDAHGLAEDEVRVLVIDRNACQTQRAWQTQAVAGVVREQATEPSAASNRTQGIEASELLYRADMGRRDIYVSRDKRVPYAILPNADDAVRYLRQHGCEVTLEPKGWMLDCLPRE